jgi:hypothetical protein
MTEFKRVQSQHQHEIVEILKWVWLWLTYFISMLSFTESFSRNFLH